MTVSIPTISERLRERTAQLAANPAAVIDRTYEVLISMEGYKTLAPSVRQDIAASINLTASLWYQSLLTGKSPSAEEMDRFREFGCRRVHQRVPLQAVLRAFRLGSREIWRTYIDLGENEKTLVDELLFAISPYLFDFFDVMAQNIAQSYLEEQYQQARWREALRHQLYSIVFHSPDDHAGFREIAEALGLDSTAPRVALAIDIELPAHTSYERERELDRIALASARHVSAAPDDLVRAWHRGRMILWVPCLRGDSINRTDRQMTERANAMIAAIPELRGIGVGLMNEGASGWSASVDEAMRALDFVSKSGSQPQVAMYSSILIEESARHASNALRYLVSLLEQLSTEPELVTTLQTYFDQGQRRGQSAAALGIHPNTLNYRIERVEALLGASLDDVSWIARLDIALKLRRAEK
ncbi:CdaR family transcriptional regulator [Paraburkholderia sp. BL25I1N1]|uniref:PucR family transcriptional regulator n=1 Tax=Paraburkholderia sp. BL25I1N1 TaxID=1938804 RepID=UPI000D05EA94|nr:helix-turn-helix domain-containing protein [Paraburkholderia sp. BL25I1N1]PRY04016.1 CdaR family transcriptional regulator [Paraburkholderia sp. BL25I1N1]